MKILRILNSKIRNKLIFGFVFISLFEGIVGYIAFSTIRDIQSGYGRISTKSLPLIQHLEEMKFACLRLISSVSEFAYIQTASKNKSQSAQEKQETNLIQQSCNSCHKSFLQYQYLVKESFPGAVKQIKEISKAGKLLKTAANKFIEINKHGTLGSEALEKKEEMEISEINFLNTVNQAISYTNIKLEEEKTQLEYTISSSFRNIFVLSGLALFISVLIGILYARSILNPITKLTQQTDHFRKGNLETAIDIKSTDEIGVLGKSFYEMAKRIKLLVAQLEDEINTTKQVEEEIQKHNEHLLRINAEKDKFFTIIAHDLKNPFHGLMSLTELMATGEEDFTKSEITEYGKSIHESATTLYKLVENLLEWAQIQKGSIIFIPKEIELQKTISKCIETVKQSAIQKGIKIINEVTGTQKVYADEKMINTVLRNLLTNAVKFTRRDGKIIIRTKKIDSETVEISVSDTGVGISEENVKNLFKIESLVSSKGTDGEQSTGLGLLLCKEFIEKHNGKIWVESEEGKGSTFGFSLSVGKPS